jgi:hypothetical protein
VNTRAKILTLVIAIVAALLVAAVLVNASFASKIEGSISSKLDKMEISISQNVEDFKQTFTKSLGDFQKNVESSFDRTNNIYMKGLNSVEDSVVETVRSIAEKDAEKVVGDELSKIKKNVERKFDNVVFQITLLSNLPSISDFFDTYEYDPVTAESISYGIGDYIIKQMDIFFADSVYVVDPEGNVLIEISDDVYYDTGDQLDDPLISCLLYTSPSPRD